MAQWLNHPPHNFITVITKDKNGKELSKKDFDDNSDLKNRFPSHDEFLKVYTSILDQVKQTGRRHTITITEQGITTVQDNA